MVWWNLLFTSIIIQVISFFRHQIYNQEFLVYHRLHFESHSIKKNRTLCKKNRLFKNSKCILENRFEEVADGKTKSALSKKTRQEYQCNHKLSAGYSFIWTNSRTHINSVLCAQQCYSMKCRQSLRSTMHAAFWYQFSTPTLNEWQSLPLSFDMYILSHEDCHGTENTLFKCENFVHQTVKTHWSFAQKE